MRTNRPRSAAWLRALRPDGEQHRPARTVERHPLLGRGSAANSAVCYVLGITAIDPVCSGLLFERFITQERREPPDIAALCATVMCFGPRGAIRDVGKVLGLTDDVTGALASQVWGWSKQGVESDHAAEANLNVDDRRLRLAIDLARERSRAMGMALRRGGVQTTLQRSSK